MVTKFNQNSGTCHSMRCHRHRSCTGIALALAYCFTAPLRELAKAAKACAQNSLYVSSMGSGEVD